MSTYRRIAVILVMATLVPFLTAEIRCPGNAASLRYRLVNGHQRIVTVSINHSGPFSFLLDTGSQLTLLDPVLAEELHLQTRGDATVDSPGFVGQGSFAQVDVVEAGTQAVAGLKVLVSDLGYLRSRGIDVDGVLGEDFLNRFDLLIDNHHNLVCLDGSGVMRAGMKGPWIPLLSVSTALDDPLPSPLIVPVYLSDGLRPLRLMLDSGVSVSILYGASAFMSLATISPVGFGPNPRKRAADGRRTYMVLPPQDARIGPAKISQVLFVNIAGDRLASRSVDFDGVLSIGVFRRIFIDHKNRLVALEEW